MSSQPNPSGYQISVNSALSAANLSARATSSQSSVSLPMTGPFVATGSAYFSKNGNSATVRINSLTGASSAASNMVFSGVPAAYTPVASQQISNTVNVTNAGSNLFQGVITVSPSGSFTLACQTGAFAVAGTAGLPTGVVCTYLLI